MSFGLNHAPGAGMIARVIDMRASALPLCYGCPFSVIVANLSKCKWMRSLYVDVDGENVISYGFLHTHRSHSSCCDKITLYICFFSIMTFSATNLLSHLCAFIIVMLIHCELQVYRVFIIRFILYTCQRCENTISCTPMTAKFCIMP